MVNLRLKILIVILILLYIPGVYALNDEDIIWSDGDTYALTQDDSMITVKEYTIKVVELPSPVRGVKTINGTRPQRPVARFATFELYKDIINSSKPIEKFTLGVDNYQIISDKELKIIVTNMPKEDSQNWVYEYYKPWVSIKIQKREVHKLDIKVVLKNINASMIDPGNEFDAEVRIKNIGGDSAKDINYNIDIGSLELVSINQSLKDFISILGEDNEKAVRMTLRVPVSIEKKGYVIFVNATSRDTRDVLYNWNYSRSITTRDAIDSILINKSTKNTIYMKESVTVMLNIVNLGHTSMDNVQVRDFVPNKLLYFEPYSKNGTYKKTLYYNRSYITTGDSWTISYTLKPVEPGIYLLPRSIVNFSMGGKDFNLMSDEKGFRVYGPVLLLNKSFTNKGKDVVEIKIKAKNIGNGFAAMVKIEDKLPEDTSLISGTTSLTTSLYADEEKVMSYTIRLYTPKSIGSILWPPANATYWLDDYKFTTSSDKNVTEEITPEDVGSKKPAQKIIVPVPTENTSQRRVVATISKKQLAPPEKETPGFISHELLAMLAFLIFIRIRKH